MQTRSSPTHLHDFPTPPILPLLNTSPRLLRPGLPSLRYYSSGTFVIVKDVIPLILREQVRVRSSLCRGETVRRELMQSGVVRGDTALLKACGEAGRERGFTC